MVPTMSLQSVSDMNPDDTALAVRIAERSGMGKDAARYIAGSP